MLAQSFRVEFYVRAIAQVDDRVPYARGNQPVRFGDIVLCAMAKGAGMIEPNMATMLVYFFTNADIDDLPIVERDFSSLARLAPGVAPGVGGNGKARPLLS